MSMWSSIGGCSRVPMPQADPPGITVIIPAYNAEKHLARALASVWATKRPALTVLIVDDGSTDGTAMLAQQLCSSAPGPCKLLRHPDGAPRIHGSSLATTCTDAMRI